MRRLEASDIYTSLQQFSDILRFHATRSPLKRAYSYTAAYFFGGLSSIIGNLLPLVNPAFYFIFAIFPPEQSGLEALGLVREANVTRFGGVTTAATGSFLQPFSLLWHPRNSGPIGPPFIPATSNSGWFRRHKTLAFDSFFFLVLAVSLLGGFRSAIVIFVLTFAIQFYLRKSFSEPAVPCGFDRPCPGASFILPMSI